MVGEVNSLGPLGAPDKILACDHIFFMLEKSLIEWRRVGVGNKQRLLQQSKGDELGDDDDYLMDHNSESVDPKDGWIERYLSR